MRERQTFSAFDALEFLVATPLRIMNTINGTNTTQRGIKRTKMLVVILPSNLRQRATKNP
jgi:hypothetical protein